MANRNNTTKDQIQQTVPADSRDPFNILIFGDIGLGKSSFINTVRKAFGARDGWAKSVPIGHVAGSSSVTTAFSSYTVPSTKIALWDTYGWERTAGNYDTRVFQSYLRGAISLGTVRPAKGAHVEDTYQAKERQVHAVLFFIPGELAQESRRQPLTNLWEEMKGYYYKALQENVQCVFVLSQLDLHPEFRDCRKQTFQDIVGGNQWTKTISVVQSVLSGDVKSLKLFPLITYQAHELEVVQTPSLEEFALQILKKAVTEPLFDPPYWTPEIQLRSEKTIQCVFHQPEDPDPDRF